MAIPVALKKRLEALEYRFDDSNDMKIFYHFIEEDPIRWEPGDPVSWQQAHPKGRAIILKFMDCGRN
jgi:hypothetical protein